jgi:uncharacterized membrane protein YjfL (UPF0719 family)
MPFVGGLIYKFLLGALVAALMLLIDRLLALALRRDAAGGEAPGRANHARALVQVGRVLGIFILAGALVSGGTKGLDWKADALWLVTFGSLAGVLFIASARYGVRLLLRGRLQAEVDRGNAAAGVAAAGHYVATALIVAAATGGEGWKMLAVSLAFFAIAQIILHVFVILFRALTSYDDAEEILAENLAAGVSYAGVTVGLGMIIAHAADGTFAGWPALVKGFGPALAWCVSLYVVRQFVVQTLILGAAPRLWKGALDEAIGRDRNVGLAAVEAGAYIGTALLLGHVS